MRRSAPAVVACAAFVLAVLGAARAGPASDAPQAIPLSGVLAELSQNPQVRDRLLDSLDKLPNAWGLIGPNQRTRLRNFILDRNWEAVDHFPGLTVAQLRASVSVANAAAARTAIGGTSLALPFVEVGEFASDRSGTASWQPPDRAKTDDAGSLVKELGYGLTMGDGPNPKLWPWHAQSERAAHLLNRLALNPLAAGGREFQVTLGERQARSPEQMIAALSESGCDVRIEDARYFANFGHLHYHGQDVVMPFWLNTSLRMPGVRGNLLVPVSHAEEEIRIRCPKGNADVSFYFGIDGMAEFRTMDTLDQAWVGRRVAHTFRSRQAREVMRLLGAMLRTYAELHRRYPNLPFRGYYRLGVCQDAVGAIERRMTGAVTLFPITHDPEYFRGTQEIDLLFRSLPNDRRNGKADWTRIRGSLPVRDFSEIAIPGLGSTLETFASKRSQQGRERTIWIAAAVASAVLVLAWWSLRRWSRLNLPPSR